MLEAAKLNVQKEARSLLSLARFSQSTPALLLTLPLKMRRCCPARPDRPFTVSQQLHKRGDGSGKSRHQDLHRGATCIGSWLQCRDPLHGVLELPSVDAPGRLFSYDQHN